MSERAKIAAAAAAGLRTFLGKARATPVTVGFDGFVDSIIAVVDKRYDADRYDPVRTIEQFGKKIVAAAGMSSNYEFVITLQKLGGNGPIMANALLAAGLPVTYLGALGQGSIHPVFQDFASRATVHSVSDPGFTDAVEFSDGKLMLGKLQSLKEITWARLEEVVGAAQLKQIVLGSRLIGMVNWTMLPRLNDVWENLIQVLATQDKLNGSRRLVFIDLADPEKRTADDLRGALALCTRLQGAADVILGVNLKESSQVASVLGIPVPADAEGAIESTARAILEKLKISTVVIHPRKCAAGARRKADGSVETALFMGPFVAEPKLSTGAGDNFNAGFCLGCLAGLTLEQALCAGTGTSGFYVRNAGSPTLAQLADFCDQLPPPQA